MDVPADRNSIDIVMGVYLCTRTGSGDASEGGSSHLKLPVPAGVGTTVIWTLVDGADRGSLSAKSSTIQDATGSVVTTLTTTTHPKDTYTVQGRVSVLVDGRRVCHYGKNGPSLITATITVVPGLTSSIEYTLTKPSLPADRQSQSEVSITARDPYGNLVADGTQVYWGNGGLGDVTPIDDETSGGQARATITSGFLAGDQKVDIALDSFERTITLANNPITIDVTSSRPSLSVVHSEVPVENFATLTATCRDSAGNLVADGTEVKFFTSNGKFSLESFGSIATGYTTAGVATATLDATNARIGQARIVASTTNFYGTIQVPFLAPAAGLYVTTDGGAITGDATTDGTVPVEQLDGSIQNAPYFTSLNVQIGGGVPRSRVIITLEGVGANLVELPEGDVVTLDARGNARVSLRAKGDAVPTDVAQTLRIRVTPRRGGTDFSTPVVVSGKEHYGRLYNFFAGFVWGGGEGVASAAGDFAAGLLEWGNIRDIAVEMYNWATGNEVDWVKVGFAAVNIVGDFFPEGPSEVCSAVRTLVKRVPPGPFRDLIFRFFYTFIKECRFGSVAEALRVFRPYINVIKDLAGRGPEFVEKLAALLNNSKVNKALAALLEKTSAQVVERLYNVIITNRLGITAAERILNALIGNVEIDEAVLKAIVASEGAFAGLAKLVSLKQIVEPATLNRVLGNTKGLWKRLTYNQEMLLSDINSLLTKCPNIVGLPTVFSKLRTESNAGKLFEVLVAKKASELEEVLQIEKGILNVLGEAVDCDVFSASKVYQAKISYRAFLEKLEDRTVKGISQFLRAGAREAEQHGGRKYVLAFPENAGLRQEFLDVVKKLQEEGVGVAIEQYLF